MLTGMETKTLQQYLQFIAIDEKPKIVTEENGTLKKSKLC
jgi:hypothetical protein